MPWFNWTIWTQQWNSIYLNKWAVYLGILDTWCEKVFWRLAMVNTNTRTQLFNCKLRFLVSVEIEISLEAKYICEVFSYQKITAIISHYLLREEELVFSASWHLAAFVVVCCLLQAVYFLVQLSAWVLLVINTFCMRQALHGYNEMQEIEYHDKGPIDWISFVFFRLENMSSLIYPIFSVSFCLSLPLPIPPRLLFISVHFVFKFLLLIKTLLYIYVFSPHTHKQPSPTSSLSIW